MCVLLICESNILSRLIDYLRWAVLEEKVSLSTFVIVIA